MAIDLLFLEEVVWSSGIWLHFSIWDATTSFPREPQSKACTGLTNETNPGVLYSTSLDLREAYLRDIHTISFWTPLCGPKPHSEMNQSQLWPAKRKRWPLISYPPSIASTIFPPIYLIQDHKFHQNHWTKGKHSTISLFQKVQSQITDQNPKSTQKSLRHHQPLRHILMHTRKVTNNRERQK